MSSILIDRLSKGLGMSERDLQILIATGPNRYKTYRIPKRSGGYREIAQPAFELKIAQRLIMQEFLVDLPVHPCATAYKAGSSIRQNAERHSQNGPIMKFDFKNFFPSITEKAWLDYCAKKRLFERADAIRAARLLFRREKGSKLLRLSIGAPSSPLLSNILLYNFDDLVNEAANSHKIVYTRYADDMTFSAERTWNLREVNGILRKAIREIGTPHLVINEEKTVVATPKFHRQVTGLVLTLDKRVSIGRDRKRVVRSSVDHFRKGLLGPSDITKLAGNLSFIKDVEPEFFTRMERVYGAAVIKSIYQVAQEYKTRKSRQR
jgi:hypothetical protein